LTCKRQHKHVRGMKLLEIKMKTDTEYALMMFLFFGGLALGVRVYHFVSGVGTLAKQRVLVEADAGVVEPDAGNVVDQAYKIGRESARLDQEAKELEEEIADHKACLAEHAEWEAQMEDDAQVPRGSVRAILKWGREGGKTPNLKSKQVRELLRIYKERPVPECMREDIEGG